MNIVLHHCNSPICVKNDSYRVCDKLKYISAALTLPLGEAEVWSIVWSQASVSLVCSFAASLQIVLKLVT